MEINTRKKGYDGEKQQDMYTSSLMDETSKILKEFNLK